jgi:hypothetical protein
MFCDCFVSFFGSGSYFFICLQFCFQFLTTLFEFLSLADLSSCAKVDKKWKSVADPKLTKKSIVNVELGWTRGNFDGKMKKITLNERLFWSSPSLEEIKSLLRVSKRQTTLKVKINNSPLSTPALVQFLGEFRQCIVSLELDYNGGLKLIPQQFLTTLNLLNNLTHLEIVDSGLMGDVVPMELPHIRTLMWTSHYISGSCNYLAIFKLFTNLTKIKSLPIFMVNDLQSEEIDLNAVESFSCGDGERNQSNGVILGSELSSHLVSLSALGGEINLKSFAINFRGAAERTNGGGQDKKAIHWKTGIKAISRILKGNQGSIERLEISPMPLIDNVHITFPTLPLLESISLISLKKRENHLFFPPALNIETSFPNLRKVEIYDGLGSLSTLMENFSNTSGQLCSFPQVQDVKFEVGKKDSALEIHRIQSVFPNAKNLKIGMELIWTKNHNLEFLVPWKKAEKLKWTIHIPPVKYSPFILDPILSGLTSRKCFDLRQNLGEQANSSKLKKTRGIFDFQGNLTLFLSGLFIYFSMRVKCVCVCHSERLCDRLRDLFLYFFAISPCRSPEVGHCDEGPCKF